MLDPAGLREVGLERPLAAAQDGEALVDDQARGARRPLVDCEDHAALITREVIPPGARAAAGQLAPGHGVLAVARVAGRSVVVERRAASPLRLLCPSNAGVAAWTYTSTFGGGLVDGDDVHLGVTVGDRAQALLATQASTKAYRGPVGVRQRVEATVGAHALLVVISDPLVPFADARIDALLDVELGDGASLAAVEGLAAGRVASGERWAAARCQTRLRVGCEGALLLDDALLLDPGQGDVAARMGPFDAWANVVLVGPAVRDAANAAAYASAVAAPARRGCSRARAGGAARRRMPAADRGGVDGYPQRPGSRGARVRRSAARGRSVHPPLVGRSRAPCT